MLEYSAADDVWRYLADLDDINVQDQHDIQIGWPLAVAVPLANTGAISSIHVSLHASV